MRETCRSGGRYIRCRRRCSSAGRADQQGCDWRDDPRAKYRSAPWRLSQQILVSRAGASLPRSWRAGRTTGSTIRSRAVRIAMRWSVAPNRRGVLRGPSRARSGSRVKPRSRKGETAQCTEQSAAGAALALGACGVGGVTYMIRVVRHARRQTFYVPDLEDWTWYGVLPLVAYTALLPAAIVFLRRPTPSLFVIAAVAVLLLFIGIHNAWDAVTYIAHGRTQQPEESGQRPSAAAGQADSVRRTLGS